MVSIRTNKSGVKLHVGSKSGAYKSTEQVPTVHQAAVVTQNPANERTKLHVGSKSGAYRSTNQVVRTNRPTITQYKDVVQGPVHEKLLGTPPYIAGSPPPSPTTNNPFVYYGSVSLVPANAEVTIVSYVVANNQVVYIQGFQACGGWPAEYTLYVNNQVVCKSMTNPGDLNSYVNLLGGTPIVQPGVTIKLTVNCPVGGGNFYGTLLGYYNTF